MIIFVAMSPRKSYVGATEWAWLHERARPIWCEDTQGIVAYDRNGTIKAAAAFDSWSADHCSVHLAIDSPIVIRAGFFHEIARHLFVACGLRRFFGLVPANNAKALKLDKHIGMKEIARIPHGFCQDIDYIVMCMEKADCRYLSTVEEAA